MWCTTECWNCEDKTCEHYRSKLDLYWENKDLKKRIDKSIEFIKKHYPTATINDQDDKHNLLNILQNGSDSQ